MWNISNYKIAGLQALQHSITEELCVFSENGEMWQHDDLTYKILTNNPKVAKELAAISRTNYPKFIEGSEIIFKININDLARAIKIFKPLPALGMQIALANKK